MLIKLLLVVAGFFLLWVMSEYVLNKLHRDNEASRKLVHILHGTGLAVLSFVVPLWLVATVEATFLLVVTAGRYIYKYKLRYIGPLQYLGKLYQVGRLSYGEFLYPVSVIICTFIANSQWEFAAALLVLGLADAAAALFGKRYGGKTTYYVGSQKKSLVGSAAFFVVTVLIVGWFLFLSGADVHTQSILTLIWLPLLLTVTENLGIYGSDNLLIPIVAVLGFNNL